MNKKKPKEPSMWSKGSFVKQETEEEMKLHTRTINMGPDEEMIYNCGKCNTKIGAHNKDWHDGMCDKCFNKEYFPDD